MTKKIDERFSELSPILEFAKDYKKDREDRAAAEETARRKKEEEASSSSDEDLEAAEL